MEDWINVPANDRDIQGIYEYLGWHFRKAGLSSNCFHYLEVLKKAADQNICATDPLMEKMVEALEDLIERANRGRRWLQNAPSGSGGNWGIFDTETAKQALQEYREWKDAK